MSEIRSEETIKNEKMFAEKTSTALNFTECPICGEGYTDPRTLPCVHTFCFQCIDKFARDKTAADGKLECPVCLNEVNIAEADFGGIAALPRNQFVEKLVAVRQLESGLLKKEALCDVCNGEDRDADGKLWAPWAVVYCVDCRQYMCQQCVAHHKKFKLQAVHNFIDLEKQLRFDDLLQKFPEIHCDQHPDKYLDVYCHECERPTCMMCYIMSHNSHKCSEVSSVAAEMRKQMKADVDGFGPKISEYSEILRQLTTEQNLLAENVTKAESDIVQRADEMTRQINLEKARLLMELKMTKRRQDGEIDHVRGQVERRMCTIDSFQRFSDELRNKGTACDVVQAAIGLHRHAEELLGRELSTEFDDDRGSVKVVFSSHTPVEDLQQVFGDLEISNCGVEEKSEVVAGDGRASATPSAKLITGMHTLPSSGTSGVSGITTLGDLIYIVRKNTQAIEVFNAITLTAARPISLRDFTANQSSLASSGVYNCLYMSEYSSSKIFRIDLSTPGGAFTSWPVGSWPFGLSVNSAHNVLVACYGANKIQEFSRNRTLVREIVLPSNLEHPTSVIQMSPSMYAVTHQGSGLHRYCVINAEGQVVRSYGHEAGPEEDQLNAPYGIAISRRGMVYIADSGNNRVLKLHPSSFAATQLTVDGGLFCPYCLHYDSNRGRLYVGELTGSCRAVIFGV